MVFCVGLAVGLANKKKAEAGFTSLLGYLVYNMDEYEVREEKAKEVLNYIDKNITDFFAGEKDPSNDAQWSEFLSTLKDIGREELMKVAQNAYDRK